MAIYLYKNKKTNKIIEREFSMMGDIPKEIKEQGKVYVRYYGSNTSFKIPFQWGQESNIKFDKSPSGKKHFY